MTAALVYGVERPSDRVFVIRSWIDSYRTAHSAGMIAMRDWIDVMAPQVERVLARRGCRVWVAHHGDAEPGADLYGWLAAETAADPLVHYCYVKQAYRRMGIARGLLRLAEIDPTRRFRYSCKTGVVSKLGAQIPYAVWTPLVVRYDSCQDARHGQPEDQPCTPPGEAADR